MSFFFSCLLWSTQIFPQCLRSNLSLVIGKVTHFYLLCLHQTAVSSFYLFFTISLSVSLYLHFFLLLCLISVSVLWSLCFSNSLTISLPVSMYLSFFISLAVSHFSLCLVIVLFHQFSHHQFSACLSISLFFHFSCCVSSFLCFRSSLTINSLPVSLYLWGFSVLLLSLISFSVLWFSFSAVISPFLCLFQHISFFIYPAVSHFSLCLVIFVSAILSPFLWLCHHFPICFSISVSVLPNGFISHHQLLSVCLLQTER